MEQLIHQMSKCDHSTMTTKFCPHCGGKNAIMREPDEIEAMLATLKDIAITKAKARKGDPLVFIANFSIVLLTLNWALGKMDNEDLLALFNE